MMALAFVRSGWANINGGNINNTGYNGDYWSRTAYSSDNGYHLNMNPTNVNPSNNWGRYGGFSLRWR
jgi:hypothetical protein